MKAFESKKTNKQTNIFMRFNLHANLIFLFKIFIQQNIQKGKEILYNFHALKQTFLLCLVQVYALHYMSTCKKKLI